MELAIQVLTKSLFLVSLNNAVIFLTVCSHTSRVRDGLRIMSFNSYPLAEKLFWVALDEYTLNDSLFRNVPTSRLRYLLSHFTDQFGSNRHKQGFFHPKFKSLLFSKTSFPKTFSSIVSGIIYSFDLGFQLWSHSWILCLLSVAYQAFSKFSWYFSIWLHTTNSNSGDLPQANMMHCLH